MILEQELETIKSKCARLLVLYPELKSAQANTRLFAYWKYYDGFGDRTLYAEAITNYHSIDRAFRYLIPQELKNYQAEESYKETFVKTDKNV